MDHNQKLFKLKKKPGPRISIPWSDLPQELLQSIATKLSTQGQIRHFRSVCKSWRQSVAPPPPTKTLSPSLLPLQLSSDYAPNFGTGSLVAFSVCLLRPNNEPKVSPWLATVEELSPGKASLREPLCRTLVEHLPRNFPRVLDLSQFHVTEVFNGYYLRLDNDVEHMFKKQTLSDFTITKVVLFVNPNPNPAFDSTTYTDINDCTLIILDSCDSLYAMRLGEDEEEPYCVPVLGPRIDRRRARKQITGVDDVVCFMGEVYAVDRRGWLFAIDYDHLTARTVVDQLPPSLSDAWTRKKWLVESSGQLYMVRRCSGDKVKFEVYELDLEQCCWNLLESLGDDRILFVTLDGCFLLSVKDDLPSGFGRLGNCIIFYRGCFYPTGGGSWREPDRVIFSSARHSCLPGSKLSVATYFFDELPRPMCRPVSDIFATLLWPPPKWLAPDPCSSIWSSEKEKIMSDSNSHNEHVELNLEVCRESSSLAEPEDEVQGAEATPSSTSLSAIRTYEQTLSDSELVYQEETHREVQHDSTSKASTSRTETSRTFEELNVKADLVPTLRKIWAKHGNITEGSVVHNGDILARALESLATVVETLQSSSGWSLEDSQADYMSSALLDLKHMQINVDWLAPSVEKALALHRSKRWIKTLAELNKAKTKACERRMKLLDELAKVEEEEKSLEEECTRVSRAISVSGEIDMDGCLGDGLC